MRGNAGKAGSSYWMARMFPVSITLRVLMGLMGVGEKRAMELRR